MKIVANRIRSDGTNQRGINMVDLMMWLVIAAMLLAAAIQGIGYYQKAAYLYQVKSDVMGGATKVLSLSGIEHNGKVDESIVGEGLVITDKTAEVVLVAATDPLGRPMIRGTHPGIPDKEVLYFFYNNGTYKSGNPYIVDIGTMLPPPAVNGDIDRDGIPNSSDPDIDNDGKLNGEDSTPNGTFTEDLSGPGKGDGVTSSTIGTITGDGSGQFNPSTPLHDHNPPMPNTLPSGVLDVGGWTSNAATRSVSVTLKTDGSFRGVGGSWIVMIHLDYSCYNTSTKVSVERHTREAAILRGPYTSTPGPNSTAVGISCLAGEIPSQVIARTASDAEWASYSLGRLGYVYSLPNMMEGWVNPVNPAA
jgi:hypothetical protein